MSNKKLLIFDLDGTVRRTKSGSTFPENHEDWELIPESLKIVEQYKPSLIVGATNQKGIKLGFVTQSDIVAGINLTMDFFPFNYVMCCPDDGENCFIVGTSPMGRYVKALDSMPFGYYRKPGTGMLNYAINNSGFTRYETLMVGDWRSDEEAAHRSSIKYLDIQSMLR